MTRGGVLWMLMISVCAFAGCAKDAMDAHTIVVGVCDPLAAGSASKCVEKSATRRYDGLAARVKQKTGITLEFVYYPFDPLLSGAMREGKVQAALGKPWTVLTGSAESRARFERLADLVPARGSKGLSGVFIVRSDGPLGTLADLGGKVVGVGPDWAYEKSHAARMALAKAGVTPAQIKVYDGCIAMAAAVLAREVDAGVVSSYVVDFGGLALASDPKDFRVIARTGATPALTFAVREDIDADARRALGEALLSIGATNAPEGLEAKGFVEPTAWKPEELNR